MAVLAIAIDIGGSIDRFFDGLLEWAPRIIGALVILIIGYILAKAIGNLIGRALKRVGLDRILRRSPVEPVIGRVTSSVSRLLGQLAFWILFLGAISIAVDVLGIEEVKNVVGAIWAYVPNVLAALVILFVAGALSVWLSGLLPRVMGNTMAGRIAARTVPVLIMAIASFMILDQLEIARNIVVITYAALISSIALGFAIAFGLGGRGVADQILSSAYRTAQEEAPRAGGSESGSPTTRGTTGTG